MGRRLAGRPAGLAGARLRDGLLEGVLRYVATGKVGRLGTPYFRAHVDVSTGECVLAVYGPLREAGQALRELLKQLEAARRLDDGCGGPR